MDKLKWVTKSVSFSCRTPVNIHQKRQLSVSSSCYPFSLTRFGATDLKDILLDSSDRLHRGRSCLLKGRSSQ